MKRWYKVTAGVVILLFLAFETNLYKKEVFDLHIEKKITYNKYGHKLAKKLESKGLHPYEICIIMLETGGVIPKENNLGNLRKKDLSYHKYDSFDKGLSEFEKCIDKKYKKRFTDDPEQTFRAIQVNYAPDGGNEWIKRAMFWYNRLYN